MMWYPLLFALAFSTARATILQNGQVRPDNYTSTAIAAITASDQNWRTYPPSAQELSYKGRWDEQHISWWTAPGLKFGFQAESVALSFGAHTSEGVLLAYRLDGQDWTLTNVTANTTQLLIEPSTPGYNLTSASAVKTLEVRITNWAYGVQLSGVHLSGRNNATLVKIPDYTRTMEFIGDSLSAGQYATLEGISSNPWALMYGLGNVEFSISAYPGICLHDSRCYGKSSNALATVTLWLIQRTTSQLARPNIPMASHLRHRWPSYRPLRRQPSPVGLHRPPRRGHHTHKHRHQRQQSNQQYHLCPIHPKLHRPHNHNPHDLARNANHSPKPLGRLLALRRNVRPKRRFRARD
jgi:hypothetical protein